MNSKYKKLETQIFDLQEQIDSLPQGELCCASNGNQYKWYLCDNHTNTYLPKHNKNLAQQLAFKKYLCALLDDLSREKRAIQFYLDHHPTSSKTEKILLHPEYQKLLASEFQPVSQNLMDWMNTPYGILPFVQLITTYETKENPLSFDIVEKMIKLYFLE